MELTDGRSNWVFFVDEGAIYDLSLSFYEGQEGYATARRTGTQYRSTEHWVDLTGKQRRQATGRVSGRSAYYVTGHRAILHLDTGEGISQLRGVAV